MERSVLQERIERARRRQITLVYGPAVSEIQFSDEGLAERFDFAFTFDNPDFDPSQVENDDEFDQAYIKFLAFDEEGTPKVPTGLVWAVGEWTKRNDTRLDLQGWPDWIISPENQPDPEVDPDIIPNPDITLRDYQVEAIRSILKYRRGVLEIATGGGKTETAIGLVLHLGTPKTIYMVPNQDAMRESFNRFDAYGIPVGRLGDNYYEMDKPVIVAIVNSLISGIRRGRMEVIDALREAELFICDEAHHKATAHTWKVVASMCEAEYRVGLSGTPWKDDDNRFAPQNLDMYDSWLTGFTGTTLSYLPPRELQRQKSLVGCVVVSVRMPASNENPYGLEEKYNDVYQAGIVNNQPRNEAICTLLANLCDLNRYPLVSIDKLAHGRILQRILMENYGVTSACSYGGGTTYIPQCVADRLGLVYDQAPIHEWVTRYIYRKHREIEALENEIDRHRQLYNEDAPEISDKEYDKLHKDIRKLKKQGKVRKRVRDVVGREEEFVEIPEDNRRLRQMFQDRDVQVLIGSKIYDEAQDITFLTDLVNAAGGKASQRYRQKVGRVLRKHDRKTLAWIWDPWDTSHYYFTNHSKQRFKIAQNEGYPCIGDWSLGEIYTSSRIKDNLIGRVTVRTDKIEVKVEMTIPLSINGQQSYTYVKPSVSLQGILEEGDNEDACAEQLHVQAMSIFMRESIRQAAQANKIVTEGFDKANNDFQVQAQAFLSGIGGS